MAARPSSATAKKKPMKLPPAPPRKRLAGAAAGSEYENFKLLHTQPQGEISHEIQTSEAPFDSPRIPNQDSQVHVPPHKLQREVNEVQTSKAPFESSLNQARQFHSHVLPYDAHAVITVISVHLDWSHICHSVTLRLSSLQ